MPFLNYGLQQQRVFFLLWTSPYLLSWYLLLSLHWPACGHPSETASHPNLHCHPAGAVAVSSSGEPLPFALAEYDQLVTTMQPAGPSTATGVTIRPQDANSALKASSGTTKVSRPNHSTSDSLQVVKAAGAGSNTA